MRKKNFDGLVKSLKWMQLHRQGKAKGGRVTEVEMVSATAKGLRGMLCCSLGSSYFLRVPMRNGKFRDLRLAHADLDIEVLDSDSAIYRFNDEYVLDHSPTTLGRRVKPARPRETETGHRALRSKPRAVAAHYDRRAGKLVVELQNGVVLQLPPSQLQGLSRASPEDLSKVQIEGAGFALHWKSLNADLSVAGLAQGVFGTQAWMSELGRRPKKAVAKRSRSKPSRV